MGLESDLDMEPEHKSKCEMIGEPQREAEWDPGSGQWFESDTDPNRNRKLHLPVGRRKSRPVLGQWGHDPAAYPRARWLQRRSKKIELAWMLIYREAGAIRAASGCHQHQLAWV